ncbi:MAG: DISARM system helicase DrmA [Lachnospiraceae bacterium]|nr:DISARM system helicase DrmA [Lachnospiraceae bacterium]
MADNTASFKHAAVREKILEALRVDLMGPQEECEVLNEVPTSSYITGMLYPSDTSFSEDETYDDQEFMNNEYYTEDRKDSSTGEEDYDSEVLTQGKFKKQASCGLTCYVGADVSVITASIKWGSYEKTQEKVLETKEGVEKEVKRSRYVREQHLAVVDIDLASFERSRKMCLEEDEHLQLHIFQMPVSDGNKMISVYLYNRRPKTEKEKEYEQVLFQVEIQLADDYLNPIFVPEYRCRSNKLEDEYYYETRPVFARGRGCAAIWIRADESENAVAVRTSFIPDYEMNDVSPQISTFPEHTFSMQFLMWPKNREESVARLRRMTNDYQKWIDGLRGHEYMTRDVFREKGNSIIRECENACRRMNEGINLIENNQIVFQAFCFMNQVMYMQRSISAYAKKSGQGIDCNLTDYQKKDHSEWRPFQIAFVLLNLTGIIYPDSKERKTVDLLYFPTGGGKTEAYLGLIAFTMAYRRLTASDEVEYEKDGGVTVFLRYTLRLLTTQQRDRLIKLVIAAEMTREKRPDLFGKQRFAIGFWVGGQVTPNKFSDYEDPQKQRDFIRKLTKQLIKCPCCGREIKESDYDIDPASKTVKITCSNSRCHFYKYKDVSLPVYLVDEEIYRKCPTIVIATVDKFATLPWNEQTGLLFGNADRFCSRCGYIAKGEEHVSYHRATKGWPQVKPVSVKPFYPPELIIQDELHLITGPLGTIYGGYEELVEELCSFYRDGQKIKPKYIVSTATIKNAKEQIRCLYGREDYAQFPPDGFDMGSSYFITEIKLPECSYGINDEEKILEMAQAGQKPFRQYVGICGNGSSVKTTLLRVYAIILQTVFELAQYDEYKDYVDPYYTLIGYFNSIRELGGAVRLLDDDIPSRIENLKKRYGHELRRFLPKKKEITSRIPSYEITKILEELTEGYKPGQPKQSCYDVVIATNMIAVGMDVDRLGLMTITGEPKQNSEYIQASSRVGRTYPGLIITVYNPYRPRDLSHYENFTGFHSQMYRYVEGTTATPFSARARDRVLHAVVVGMLRLQHEELAANKNAGAIISFPDEKIQELKREILDRVMIVNHRVCEEAEREMDDFIRGWRELCRDTKPLSYYTNDKGVENRNRLLNYYHSYCKDREKPTLNSMREVEKAATIYYYNKEEG